MPETVGTRAYHGMNFEVMPELGRARGYFAVPGTMAAIVVTLTVIFRKRRWLWNTG